MAEYIEREKIREEYEKLTRSYVRNDPYIADWRFDEMIESLPASDVAPVRHGRWEEADWVEPDCHGFVTIITPNAALRCSNCKNCFKKELLWKDNYCPNCGTDMRGSNDE